MFWDSTYILVLIGAAISAIASANVNSTFRKFDEYGNSRGYQAQEVARMMLQDAGIFDVRVEHVRGNLTDHYDPRSKVLHLSDSVYGSDSIAAIGVAAHECGHAIQHQVGYGPLKLRSLSVPVANFGSRLSWPLVLLGIFMGNEMLAGIGVLLFTAVVAFQLITLPVEFNASRRAMETLEGHHILMDEELTGAGKVLKAAALTYVAALFAAILQLLRLVAIANRRRD